MDHQEPAAVALAPAEGAHRDPTRSAALAIAGAAVLWGSMGPIATLYPRASVLAVGSWRLVIGALALVTAVSVGRRGWTSWRRADLATAVPGALAVAAYSALYFPAVQLSGVATATVVSIGAAPLLSGATRALSGGRLTRHWLAGTTVAVVGMCLVVLPGSHDSANWLGILLAVLAAAAYAWQAHTIERLAPRHGPIETVAVLFTGAALVLLPVGIAGVGAVTAAPKAVIGLLYLGLFTTALAYGSFAFGVPHVGAPAAVSLSLLEPVAATALAALIAQQIPTVIQVTGVATTLAGLGWLSRRSPGKTQAASRHRDRPATRATARTDHRPGPNRPSEHPPT